MNKTKIGALLLALTLLLAGIGSTSVFAAEAGNDALETYRLQLQEKYGIDIRYDSDPDGSPAIGTGSLATLDLALGRISAPVVRQVSAHYQKTLGRKLSYSFVYSQPNDLEPNLLLLGSFNTETAVIELYIPSRAAGTFTTGNSPITIAHEFAHAYYFMFIEQYGEARMEREWVALNGGVSYNEGFIAYYYNKVAFMSGYGATSLEEDFAEIFGHAVIRNQEGQGFSHRLISGEGGRTPLGKKVDFIADSMSLYLTDTAAAQTNLRAAFTTQTFLYYQGVSLSGESLQFMGCSQPRYVLNGILGLAGITAEQSDWIRDIGGWQVRDSAGNWLLIFPGGEINPLREPLALAA